MPNFVSYELEKLEQLGKIKSELLIYRKTTNPNLSNDIKKFLKLKSDSKEIQDLFNTIKENEQNKIHDFIERIEFIDHLSVVEKHIQKEKYILDGNEVVGINDNIRPLRLYLVLEAISQFAPFEDFKSWLKKNLDEMEKGESIKTYFERKIKEYEQIFGVTQNFRKIFAELPDDEKNKLINNITINGKTDYNEMVSFFVQIRNRFTHRAERLIFSNSLNYSQVLMWSGDPKSKTMELNANFNLIETLRTVALYIFKKFYFGNLN